MQTTQEIFETIYREKLWGGRKLFWRRFYSGSGSADENVIGPYVAAVLPLISGKHVLDIGCGDFTIGSRLYKAAAHYIACDIARPLIEYNRKKFSVEFRVIDATEDDLPNADIVLIRQVLQHLSNAQVAKIAPKLCRYRCAIITEHIHNLPGFVPNLDIASGADHRGHIGSGIVLTAPPFNLKAQQEKTICEVETFDGIIRTTLFEF
ncbi:class I SAM-dependent methyltransferase [Bradyrhizobium erythrophlei]|uniref:Methyltransferase domain-containing protein n=1 Tax=Bradyrhizobium erythrophlei TaxID=1437360 RepID=A0A1M5TEU0_9BRAD|nr:class I SAM-dependent methyltransferase [Bradyrhizobium erythrophlei]SHH49345.1 Methyltransferase domain-containing protein [Bradyrhizobium erythrophlei]